MSGDNAASTEFNDAKSHNDQCSTSGSSNSNNSSANNTPCKSLTALADFDDLIISENHYAEVEYRFSNQNELEAVIEKIKITINEAPVASDERKRLVKKLVEFRLYLQEFKDSSNLEGSLKNGEKVLLGHRFQKLSIDNAKSFCDCCGGILWSIFNPWYHCVGCEYNCHQRCIENVTRKCAKLKVQENPVYILDLCCELPLSSQQYKCAECKSKIAFQINGYFEPRLCDYSGFHYCPNCHWNYTEIIPARVLKNWDFQPRRVANCSAQFLRLMKNKPILDVETLNPHLFGFVDELSIVRKLREDILAMKEYFLVCKEALKSKLLLRLVDRQHFVDGSRLYSLRDLCDISTGVLIDWLMSVHCDFSKHIKEGCEICKGRGFICELCGNGEVLFSFDTVAMKCQHCSLVFHRECFNKRTGAMKQCPKCIRKVQRALQDEGSSTVSKSSDNAE